MEGGKTNHYSLTFSLILPLALSDNCCVSSGETSVERAVSAATCILYIYIYIYICVSVYIYIYINVHIHTQPSRITTANHRQKNPHRSLQRREEGREKGTAPGRCTLSCSYINVIQAGESRSSEKLHVEI